MRTTMNISLPPDLRQWVDKQVEEGGFGTASEYVRDMLRRARERKVRRQIDAMLVEAVEAGVTNVMDDQDFASIRERARRSLRPSRSKKGRQ